jgi:uncharacterized protein YecA (UPF0149 family)
MSLYNEINAFIREEATRPLPYTEFRDDLLANFESEAPVAQWSRGFTAGHLWLEESWEEYLPEKIDEQLGAVLTTLTFFSSRSIAESLIKESGKPASSLETFAAKLSDVFPDALRGYAQIGSAIGAAVQQAASGTVMPTASKTSIGRNQPCPCGSGKKYKRCCGANTQ